VKIFAALALFLACLAPAYADTVDVTATTCNTCGAGIQPAINFQAQLTTQLVTGGFLDPFEDFVFHATEEEVTSLTGTLNGMAISLGTAPAGDGSWLFPGFGLGAIWFTVAGQPGLIFFDDAHDVITAPNQNTILINFSATEVNAPEPSSLALVLTGLCLLLLTRRGVERAFTE
jgi:hypothetical protein